MNDDLDDFVQEAEQSLIQGQHSTTVLSRKKKHSLSFGKSLPLILILVIAFTTYFSMDNLTPLVQLDNTAVQANMLDIMRQARDSVESNRDQNGVPPPVLPNASLARIVYYRSAGENYELTLMLNGNIATLDFQGNLSINGDIINDTK